jgi:hypothetical protein
MASLARCQILNPFRPAFDPTYEDDDGDTDVPPHCLLFHCYVYQFHLSQLSSLIVSMVRVPPQLAQTSFE